MKYLGWVGGMWTAAIACAAMGCMSEGSTAHHLETGPDPGTVLTPTGGDQGPGPVASSVAMPARPAGDVTMDVAVTGQRDGTPAVTLEISRDGGASYGPASMGPPAAGATPDHVTVVWHSLADLGVRVDAAQGMGPARLFTTPAIHNRHAAARRVDFYLANYGAWSDDSVAIARRYQMVIAHPQHADLRRETVAALQQGVKPDDAS